MGKPKKPENRTAEGGATRRSNGTFVGSGNPGGRPKAVAEVRDLARAATPEVIKRLTEIVKSGDSDSASVAAGKELLDRAWGKAPQSITADVSLHALTDEQLEAKLNAILAVVAAE